MKLFEIDNHAMKFHETQITIDSSKSYAEIVDVYRKTKDGPGFVIVTCMKAIGPQNNYKQNIAENLRRLEP